MEDSKMSKIEYDLKAIMYSTYDTPHKLCNISGNWIIQQRRLPTNNAGKPMRQFKLDNEPQIIDGANELKHFRLMNEKKFNITANSRYNNFMVLFIS